MQQTKMSRVNSGISHHHIVLTVMAVQALTGRICLTAMVQDMKSALERVCVVNEEYDKHGKEHLDWLIDVYAHCMGIVTSLWLELFDHVEKKFLHGKRYTQPYFLVCVTKFLIGL